MRIDTIRAGAIGSRGAAGRTSSGVPFHVNDGSQTQRATPMSQASATQDIGSLLALQSVEDPLQRRRRLVRRGRQLLDTLESLRNELLLGRVSEAGLNQLVGMLANARERGEAGLDALLDDIELRVRVELAKRGIFPG